MSIYIYLYILICIYIYNYVYLYRVVLHGVIRRREAREPPQVIYMIYM